MSLRPVKQIFETKPTVEGAGVRLQRAFGFGKTAEFDPFLLLDDFRSDNPADYIAGFPWHPHRGIETITYVLAGEVAHGDSLGNKGRMTAGDVQWMTAGSGILHQEMPKGDDLGRMHGFQLWANLPAALKMTAPRYQDMAASVIPEVTDDDGTRARVGQGLAQLHAHQQRSHQARPAGHGDAVEVVRYHARFGQGSVHHRHHRRQVLPRRHLGHHPAVLGVHQHLRGHDIRAHPPPVLDHRRSGLIAGGFDTQNQHPFLRRSLLQAVQNHAQLARMAAGGRKLQVLLVGNLGRVRVSQLLFGPAQEDIRIRQIGIDPQRLLRPRPRLRRALAIQLDSG